jgi:hypothetical protein
MKRNVFFLLALLIMFSACNNEVDINADTDDISVLYGLLDQTDNQHFVKLTRAFLIDGNVYIGAADASISEYDPSDIEMVLDEYRNGNYQRSIPMDTVLVTNKDSGDFYFPNQLVYATPKNTILNEDNSYEVVVNIKSLDKQVRANTSLVKDFSIIRPTVGQRFVGMTGTLPQSVEWRSAENGKVHQLTIRFYYTEVDANSNRSVHFVDLPLSMQRSNGTNGGEKIKEEFYGESFYMNLAANIDPPASGMVRYPDSVVYIFSVADENFAVYMDVNQPATGIITEKPAYTNVENGLGIFAGRYNKERFFEGLATQSVDTLINGQYTYQLGFEKYPLP